MKILATFALLSVVLISCCSARTQSSRVEMVFHEIRIGDETYRFSVPTGESGDFPSQKVFSGFDFSVVSHQFPPEGFALIQKYWDYRNGRVGLNKDGTLTFQIRVRQFMKGFKYDASRPDMLDIYISDELSEAYGELNRRYLAQGYEQMIIKVPDKIERVIVGGKKAFHYRLSGGKDFDSFVIPVSEDFFVQMQFGFIDNSLGRGMQWRDKAQADADRIRSSMKIQ